MRLAKVRLWMWMHQKVLAFVEHGTTFPFGQGQPLYQIPTAAQHSTDNRVQLPSCPATGSTILSLL